MSPPLLPTVNAGLNAASALLLWQGWLRIREGRIRAHRACMVAAFACSCLFLGLYLTYHAQVGSVRYGGPLRPLYLAILGSHTVLAAANLPLILRALWLAWKGRYEAHKKAARWAWPVWMYVSVTGVVIYWMLYIL